MDVPVILPVSVLRAMWRGLKLHSEVEELSELEQELRLETSKEADLKPVEEYFRERI